MKIEPFVTHLIDNVTPPGRYAYFALLACDSNGGRTQIPIQHTSTPFSPDTPCRYAQPHNGIPGHHPDRMQQSFAAWRQRMAPALAALSAPPPGAAPPAAAAPPPPPWSVIKPQKPPHLSAYQGDPQYLGMALRWDAPKGDPNTRFVALRADRFPPTKPSAPCSLVPQPLPPSATASPSLDPPTPSSTPSATNTSGIASPSSTTTNLAPSPTSPKSRSPASPRRHPQHHLLALPRRTPQRPLPPPASPERLRRTGQTPCLYPGEPTTISPPPPPLISTTSTASPTGLTPKTKPPGRCCCAANKTPLVPAHPSPQISQESATTSSPPTKTPPSSPAPATPATTALSLIYSLITQTHQAPGLSSLTPPPPSNSPSQTPPSTKPSSPYRPTPTSTLATLTSATLTTTLAYPPLDELNTLGAPPETRTSEPFTDRLLPTVNEELLSAEMPALPSDATPSSPITGITSLSERLKPPPAPSDISWLTLEPTWHLNRLSAPAAPGPRWLILSTASSPPPLHWDRIARLTTSNDDQSPDLRLFLLNPKAHLLLDNISQSTAHFALVTRDNHGNWGQLSLSSCAPPWSASRRVVVLDPEQEEKIDRLVSLEIQQARRLLRTGAPREQILQLLQRAHTIWPQHSRAVAFEHALPPP